MPKRGESPAEVRFGFGSWWASIRGKLAGGIHLLLVIVISIACVLLAQLVREVESFSAEHRDLKAEMRMFSCVTVLSVDDLVAMREALRVQRGQVLEIVEIYCPWVRRP